MEWLFAYHDIKKKGADEEIIEDTLLDKTQKYEFFPLSFL